MGMDLTALVKACFASLSLLYRDLKPRSWRRAEIENGPKYLSESYKKLSDEEKENLVNAKFFGGWKMFWKIVECMSDSTELKIGDSLPTNIEVFEIQSQTFSKLEKVIDPEKTTILNFGSCT